MVEVGDNSAKFARWQHAAVGTARGLLYLTPLVARGVRKTENRFGFTFLKIGSDSTFKTRPSENLTFIRKVFRQKLPAIRNSN